MKSLRWLLVSVILVGVFFPLLTPSRLVHADDPVPGTKEDNACYTGGVMEGKCDTPWEWVCGYYLARWLTAGGWANPQNKFVDWCASLLPPQPLPSTIGAGLVTPTWPPAGCHYSPIYSLYIIWAGNQTQGPPIEMTWDGTCATPPHTGVGGFFLVSAPDPTSAAALCTGAGYTFIDEVASVAGAWSIYRCLI